MQFAIELEQESDGRWIADVLDLPGVTVYGSTPEAAVAAAKALTLRVLADRIEHGELAPADLTSVSFAEREPLAVD
jgi:predicted RNase H-like HicB family nuclease